MFSSLPTEELSFEKSTLTNSSDLLFPQQQSNLKYTKFWQALLESGASAHMFGHLRFFVQGSLKPCFKKIECADKKLLYSYWTGTVLLIRDPKLTKEDESNVVASVQKFFTCRRNFKTSCVGFSINN